MKKVLFEGNGLTLTEKSNKKRVALVFEYNSTEKVPMDLTVMNNDHIELFIFDNMAGVFGYTDEEVASKMLDFKKFKIKQGKNKVSITIPRLNIGKHQVTEEEIVEVVTELIETYDTKGVSQWEMDEKVINLQKLKNAIVKFGVKR